MTHGTIILGHVFKLMPRAHGESLDNTSSTGRPSRVLRRWSPFGALVFAHLAGRHRLRDVVTSMASPSEALASRGVTPPQRATRAEANARRPAALYQRLLATFDARGQAVAPGHRCRFKNPLCSVDSTTSSLGLHRCPWARDRTATGAITGQTLLDHSGDLPACVVSTAGKRSDLAIARGRPRPKGSLVAMDRGDLDERCLCRLPQDPVDFVIRQKRHAQFTVTTRVAGSGHHGVTSDQHSMRRGHNGQADPDVLRRVGYRDPATGQHDVLWTHACHLAAATMAALYQARWPIERFFNAIQQDLQLKTFLGTSENAVMTHIWVALLTSRLLAFLRCKSGLGLSFPQRLRLLYIHLFDRRNLVD